MTIWLFFSDYGATAPLGQGFLIVEDSWSHSDTAHSVGFLWTSDHSAFKYVILLGVLCSRILPYFSILILKWRWFVIISISSWSQFCTSWKKYEIEFCIEGSVVFFQKLDVQV